MKKWNIASGAVPVGTVLLATSLLPVGLYGRQDPQRENPQQREERTTTRTEERDMRTFTGRVAKNGDKYVLEDPATNTSYVLDDQKRAKKYEGKNVTVTGRLDSSTNVIHVQRIHESA